ncbi:MAG: hypothetical protein ABIM50_12590 [Novosphingobium sp.]
MDAPLYPPATRFEQPQRLPRVLSTKETSIADLQKNPAAWAIVVKEIPGIGALVGSNFKVHLGNFSLQTLVQFGASQADGLQRIDPQLKALGEVK